MAVGNATNLQRKEAVAVRGCIDRAGASALSRQVGKSRKSDKSAGKSVNSGKSREARRSDSRRARQIDKTDKTDKTDKDSPYISRPAECHSPIPNSELRRTERQSSVGCHSAPLCHFATCPSFVNSRSDRATRCTGAAASIASKCPDRDAKCSRPKPAKSLSRRCIGAVGHRRGC